MTALRDVATFLDDLLHTRDVRDYDQALNGVQFAHTGPVRRVAVAVDFSLPAIRRAVEGGANLLIVHHGMFWSGAQPFTGVAYDRLRALVTHDVAVYASHLPLDRHPMVGNNVLLARALDLVGDRPFGQYRDQYIGVSGDCDIATVELAARLRQFAEPLGSSLICTPIDANRRSRRWAVVTGGGASSASLREAVAAGVDTLIVGEGPHHTAIEAMELGIAVMYAGHYATETLGVRALGAELERTFGLPWFFVDLPSGL